MTSLVLDGVFGWMFYIGFVVLAGFDLAHVALGAHAALRAGA